jgi:hypothetical protein
VKTKGGAEKADSPPKVFSAAALTVYFPFGRVERSYSRIRVPLDNWVTGIVMSLAVNP